jgi:16S rRNA (uracil1498-N3)-methyltransferase
MRRFFVERLGPRVELDERQARHAARVLRLKPGDAVTLFDGRGHEADGRIARIRPCVIEAGEPRTSASGGTLIAAALPKGKRADFMVEKLSELGVAAFRPVHFARSVRRATASALRRFERIAVESAKQCGRARVMEILEPATPAELPADLVVADPRAAEPLRAEAVLIGPEGGLTDAERARFSRFGRLARNILRIETAAIAAAVLCGDASDVI